MENKELQKIARQFWEKTFTSPDPGANSILKKSSALSTRLA
jgi:hypothetical protein